jgi:serpin B
MTASLRLRLAIVLLSLPLATACGRDPLKPVDGSSVAVSDKPRDRSPAAAPDQVASLAGSNSAFAFDLYGSIKSLDGNLFLSPYSISTALAMTYAGAAGQTADQMAGTLHFDLQGEALHSAFNAYALDLEARAQAEVEGTPFELSIANSLWGQEGFAFRPEFLDLLAENYAAGMRLVDFAGDPEASRRVINRWVSDETRQRIEDLIPEGAIDTMTRLVLANAIYFKASWLTAFDPDDTVTEPFYRLSSEAADVPMMRLDESYRYAIGDGYKAIELPYQSGDMSMLIFLPDEGDFQAFEDELGPDLVDRTMAEMTYGPVHLGLPRFTYESSFSLKDALKALGMADAFDPDRADFSGMDGARDLYISDVLHKAFVAVDEEGTEAAAATAVIMGVTSAPAGEPITFIVDRPFIYLIRDGQTGSILFLGRVLDPSQ